MVWLRHEIKTQCFALIYCRFYAIIHLKVGDNYEKSQCFMVDSFNLLFFWTLINVFELLTDVPFIISVCGTIFIFAAVVVHLVIVIKSIKDKKK